MNDKIIPEMLSKLSPVVIAIVIVLVLAASMSTLSSLVLTSSSTLTLDVIVPASKKGFSEKKKLFTLRLFIVFFIVVSALIAIVKDMFPGFTFIAQMMGVSWGALAGAFLAPFLYGLYWKRTTKLAVALSFAYGVGIEIVQLLKDFGFFTIEGGFFGFVFTNSLYSGVFAMVGGLILVPIVSLISPKLKKEDTEKMFSCYDREVKVLSKESLGK